MPNEEKAILAARIASSETEEPFCPSFFRLATAEARGTLADLLRGDAAIQISDTLRAQLRDLIRSRHPARKLTSADLDALMVEQLGSCPLDEYGVWVYYPWKRQIVHLLDAEEFAELRANRNQNKITRTEQQRLATVSAGIAGLSVGNAVALTLTLEGAYGRLTLADFDRLDLSNMNRLRAGVCDIDLPKTILTARQIYEINPFAQLRLMPEGLTPDNLDQFLRGLDIVIDECDDIRIKIMLRERARERRLPVLMETSDRGMLDVERFDLEPERPILHGLLGSLSGADIAAAPTMEEKLRYVLPIIGVESVSPRAAASMIEVEESISTWPQTAAEVTAGGATISLAVRRIALGRPLPSGRRYADLEELIARVPAESVAPPCNEAPVRLAESTLDEIPELLRFVVSQAVLAPSGGNAQPWRFHYDGETLRLFCDRQRAHNLIDPQQTGAYLALGAALKNVSIAAAHRGYAAELALPPDDLRPRDSNLEPVADIRLRHEPALAHSTEAALAPHLSKRVTNRRAGAGDPLPATAAEQLRSIAAEYGCELKLIAGEQTLAELGDIIGEADRLRLLCPELHQALMTELRWSPREAEETGDGIDLATLELTPTQQAVMTVLKRPEVAAILREQNGGMRLRDLSAKAMRNASAMGLLSVQGHSRADRLRGGQAMQHLWLTANALGWAWYPMTALIYLLDASPAHQLFNDRERASLASLGARFDRIFPASQAETRLMLFRLTLAAPPSARSLRLPLAQALRCGKP
jgi:molybdopterin/thiamine biosynthesis adenylyltransferase/nitroreductase